ncbi:MAG: glycoside hydrolase [Pirellulaceae bacterium]|nr:glycoside hydrolase [Pirellulaceae bacterium]
MNRRTTYSACCIAVATAALSASLLAQQPPYDVFPPADPPYYRVRYEASTESGGLVYAVNYTVWIPSGVKMLRGVIVHQHGCGEGSCKSGLTGAYDLHWQALAKKHDCALLSPSYEQPDQANCQLWCDPRNGSDAAFQRALFDLGAKAGHPELATVPWALWGHSGGGHWAGGMVLLHPQRVAAAWLRSGVPALKAAENKPTPYTIPDGALKVPVMCNLGTKEGVTVKDGRFAGVWPGVETFFTEMRTTGALVCVAVDPLTSHECGNQRYFAIPWLDACLRLRLPNTSGDPLNDMPAAGAWLAPLNSTEAVPAADFSGDPLEAAWLPNESMAQAWMQYVKDTALPDGTPPPAPMNLRVDGDELSWEAEADLESGLARFVIERDGQFLANVPEQSKNPFGRPVFQGLQYSDTPIQPLVPLRFTDTKAEPGRKHIYRIIAVNTVGLESKPSADSVAGDPSGDGPLRPFLGESKFQVEPVFQGERFPNLVVALDGTVLATWGSQRVRVRRSEDGGESWGPEIPVGDGIHGGGAVVDERSGTVLLFTHPVHPPRDGTTAPRTVYRSADHGKTWQVMDSEFHPDANGFVPSLHMSERGTTLGSGPHAGRLVRPARVYRLTPDRYCTVIYSDDGGRNWQSGEPFPVKGTGEGALVELASGRLMYSSRISFFAEGEPLRHERLFAVSDDGGRTWQNPVFARVVPDGPRYRGVQGRGANYNGHFGMFAGFARLPIADRDILIYSNADHDGHERIRLTVWVSFDGGVTWPVKRLVHEGLSAYSSLVAGRPGTPSEGWIYLLFEYGQDGQQYVGGQLARFNLAWLKQGEATGDGQQPEWMNTD